MGDSKVTVPGSGGDAQTQDAAEAAAHSTTANLGQPVADASGNQSTDKNEPQATYEPIPPQTQEAEAQEYQAYEPSRPKQAGPFSEESGKGSKGGARQAQGQTGPTGSGPTAPARR